MPLGLARGINTPGIPRRKRPQKLLQTRFTSASGTVEASGLNRRASVGGAK